MITRKLTDKEFRNLISNLFVFHDLIGDGNMMDYRKDIENCMKRIKAKQEVNLWTMDVAKYTGKQRQGEGWVSLGVRQVSSALGAMSESIFGSDTAAIVAKFSLQNILRSVYDDSEKMLMLEILLEATFIWEAEAVPVVGRNVIRSMADANALLEKYKQCVASMNIHEVTRRMYMRYGDIENISEWTRFHVRVVNDEYANLIKKIKAVLSNKLDDAQLPTMLVSLQKQVDDMERITKKTVGGRRANK